MRYIVLVCALFAVGCHSSSNTNPAPVVTSTSTIGYYYGSMDVSGGTFWTVVVSTPGTFAVTLESVTPGTTIGTTNPPLQTVMGLAIGVGSSDGTTCTVDPTTIKNTGPGFTSQLTAQAVAGASCVQLVDVGNLTGPVSFIVRIVHT